MTNLWHLHPVLRRLETLLKEMFPPQGEIPFRKYEVAPRPGAESLRRRLLLRSPGGHLQLRPAKFFTRSMAAWPSAGKRWPPRHPADDQSACPL